VKIDKTIVRRGLSGFDPNWRDY